MGVGCAVRTILLPVVDTGARGAPYMNIKVEPSG